MRRSKLRWTAISLTAALCGLFAFGGCSSDENKDSDPKEKPEVIWPLLECDSLVPEYCRYPFPSNVFTQPDESTKTGRRVKLSGDFLLKSRQGPVLDGSPWDKSDGFSTGVAAMTLIPNATTEGCATPLTIERSLEADSPTILLDAETLERVPHWVDIDQASALDETSSFMLRPAVRLKDATRYIVAIRNIQTKSGPAEPSPAFKALRDRTELAEDASVEARRGLYADIFQRLDEAGVARENLVIAWDYTTASRENNTSWMLKMRDEALAQAGDSGPAYTIDSVETDWNDDEIAFRVFGKMEVPLYVDAPEPGSRLLFGEDGMPTQNKERPTYEVPFELLIPNSALNEPAKVIQYAHGLLGGKEQIESAHFRSFMNEYNYAFLAVDLIGMSSPDEAHITEVISSGEFHNLQTMFDRLHQGVLNNLLTMRMLKNGLSKDAQLGQYLNADERYFHGISQGGIFGGVYMALTTDVERGVLGVMGQSYNLLLNRSVDFVPFFSVVRVTYPDSRDQQIALSLVQMLWDRVEPNGYTPYITKDNLPGTPKHEVLMRAAVGDHQVSTLGAAIMARAVGTTHLDTKIRDVWGLDKAANVPSGSSYVEYDFGLPDEPLCNRPMSLCADPHGKVRVLDEARKQLDLFLRTGETRNFCEGGSCRFDNSGCTGDESTASLCE